MPETVHPNLIRMIRLVDGELSADEAKPLRRQIADDVKLAEQYQHLTRVLATSMSPDELLVHAGQVDALKVASFVDCRMGAAEQAAFERRCWTSDSLLREVVSIWRAERVAEVSASEPVSDERVQSVVTSVLGSTRRAPRVDVTVHSRPEANVKPVQEKVAEAEQIPESDGQPETVVPKIIMIEEPQANRQTRRSSGLVWVTTGLVLAFVVVALQFFWRPWEDQRADRDEEQPNGNPGEIESPQFARDEGDPERPPQNVPEIPDDPDPNLKPESDPIVRKEPGPSLVPDNPKPEPPPAVNVRTLVEWSDVRGIAGVRDSASTAWSGLLSEPVADLWKSDARTQLLTLAQSSVSGQAANGARLVVASDSVLEISERRGSRSSPTDKETPIAFQVSSGRIAMTGLGEGQRVSVFVGGEVFEIQATRDGSTIAIEREAQETILASYRGAAIVNGQELTRRRWASVNSGGDLTMLRPQRVVDWYRDPAPDSLPASLCEDFNQAGNLVQMAASVRQSQDPVTGFVATLVALQCSTSSSDPLPLNLARQIAGSGNEAHRQTLVQWLVTRVRQNPSAGDADLKMLFRLQQVDRQTATRMTGWFQAAAEGQRPTVMQLTELTNGLRNSAPLFTRQSAKYFLQKILGDPLTEYNPQTPANRAALSSVTRKVRAWQQANLK